MQTTKDKIKSSYDALKADFGYKNLMQAPKIEKVIVSAGVGSFKDKKKIDIVLDRLTKITGQKPIKKGAKKSIAAFKVRENDIVGIQVTLRGYRMYDFLDRLLNIALPRTKDFRGISSFGIDEMGNYTLGIRENTIFPESADEDLKDVFGLAITVVTSANNPKETKSFLTHLGFPFKKVEVKEPKVAKKKDFRPKVKAEEK
jgi:large subunit ribosomal protein L5